MIEYYTPPTAGSQELIGVARPSEDKFSVIQVRLKEEAVIRYMSHDIYSNWSSGVRELFANELTAARTAAKFGAQPRIEITLNPKTRELTIEGVDSLGITQEVFTDVLLYYGRSGNLTGTEVGQFGFGFKAYLNLGENIRVETFARQTNERYGVIGQEGAQFILIPEKEITIKEYGTKVSLTLRSKIDLKELVQTIEEVCRFADIDTYLTITSPITEKSSYSGYEYVRVQKGRRKINYTIRGYVKKQFEGKGYEFELDEPDFYFYGFLRITQSYSNRLRGVEEEHVDTDSDRGEIRLVKMPIEATIPSLDRDGQEEKKVKPSYPMSYWVINLKDERRYTPTPDRERLKDGLLTPVHKKTIEFLKARFAELDINSFEDYRNSPYKPIFNSIDDAEIREMLTEQTRRTCSALATKVLVVNNEGGNIEEVPLRTLASQSRHIFIMPRKEKSSSSSHPGYILPLKTSLTLHKILRAKYGDAEVFLHPTDPSYYSDHWGKYREGISEQRKTLTQYGVLHAESTADDVKKELGNNWREKVGIKKREKKAQPTEVVVWRRDGYRIMPSRVKPESLDINVIRIKGNLPEWIDLLREYNVETYGVTKDMKVLTTGISEEEFAQALSQRKVATSSGTKTLAEAIGTSKPIIVFRFPDTDILQFYGNPRSQTICVDGQQAFETIAFLKISEKKFVVKDVVDEKAVKDLLKIVCNSKGSSRASDEDSFEHERTAVINYLYMASQQVKSQRLLRFLKDALSHADSLEEMKVFVETAVRYYTIANHLKPT